jgi:hypothetical protein
MSASLLCATAVHAGCFKPRACRGSKMKCEYPSYRRAAQVIQCPERNVGKTDKASTKAWKHAIFLGIDLDQGDRIRRSRARRQRAPFKATRPCPCSRTVLEKQDRLRTPAAQAKPIPGTSEFARERCAGRHGALGALRRRVFGRRQCGAVASRVSQRDSAIALWRPDLAARRRAPTPERFRRVGRVPMIAGLARSILAWGAMMRAR